MSTANTLEEQLEEIYRDAAIKLREITERHKQEIDAYIEELKQEKIKKLKEELHA